MREEEPSIAPMLEERASFAVWYRDSYPSLYRAMVAYTRNPGLAADICAEAYLKALRRWPSVARMSSPQAWLFKVACNLAKRDWRRLNRAATAAARAEDTLGSTQPVFRDPSLWAAVDDLPARQREVVILRYVGDLTESEIGRALGLSTGGVSASLSAARRRLSEDPRIRSDEGTNHGR